MRVIFLIAWCVVGARALEMESIPSAHFSFSGVVGERVNRNVEEWLLRAPTANPGMLEMFRVRDRAPGPQIVPWAGEFVGKYLISAIQALRMSDDARLRGEVERVVRELIATQDANGYLGPFPRKEQLRGNWDLWGHYHCIEALLMWHEQTGDGASLAAARRAGDLICATFLDGDLRVFDAGSPEMNMAIITALGHLHRITKEPRYFAMMREIEKDWERAGDYFRAGLEGRDFYLTPRPRWESLHDLQGLVELHRITGEATYRNAFENLWRSIARNDVHNTGAFSSGEQATGNPYAPGAIETCCTVAWMATSIDMLRLTGDAQAAELLELALFNGGLGAQHPSGRWWTYNTPMDGAREASAHTIVFQARAGTPELNCCSVNGPRALGCLSEWAIMRQGDALVVNYFGPGKYEFEFNGEKLAFEISGNYPFAAESKLTWIAAPKKGLRLKLRNPSWSGSGRGYAEISKTFQNGEAIPLNYEPAIRVVSGAREMARKISIYRGPILLAYDQDLNAFDEQKIPRLDPAQIKVAKSEFDGKTPLSHWLELTVRAGDKDLRLCDFATAGARGTRYRSWLPIASSQSKLGPDALVLDAADPIETAGTNMIARTIEEFPAGDFTVALRVKILELPQSRLGQIFSAWCAPSDDPLRLVIDNGKLFARIENPGHNSSTSGMTVATNHWLHLAAVKSGDKLKLYVDGKNVAETSAPSPLITNSGAVALGGNPRFTGNEFLRAQFSNFKFFARGLSEAEIKNMLR